MTRRDGPKKNFVRILALAGLYVLTGKAGLMLATVTRSISLVWPPTGLSLAALVLFGPELWPGVFLGAFLTNALTPDMSWLAASGIALGNTLEATVGVALLRRNGFLSSLERVSDVVSLVILGAASVAVSASIGTACLWLHGALTAEALPVAWREWWTGDLLSDLVLAPVLLSWGSAARVAWNQAKVLEGAVLLGSATVVTVSPLGLLSATEAIPQRYAVFPFVIWAALRFGVRGAAIANVLTSSVATLATIHGVGPFGGMTFAQSLLLQQVFMGVVALTSLVLGASVAERDRALAASSRDISERSRLEQELRERVAELALADRRKAELLAVVSHDLRNPLSVIAMNTALLRKVQSTSEADPRSRKWAEAADRAADRMKRLISDLLDMESIESGRLTIRAERHDAIALVSEAVQTQEPLASGKSLHLDAEIPQTPLSEGPLSVFCDRDRVLQVFSNLIGNAIKFTPAGGSITVRAESLDDEVKLSVRDTGEGITAENLGKLWQRGFQSSEGREGLGLGLFIVKGIVSAHGGRVGVESAPGKGSTFWFTLPTRSRAQDLARVPGP